MADHFGYRRTTVSVAASVLDRFVSSASYPSPFEKRFFQLSAMSAFHLAAKMCEGKAVSFPQMSALSRGLFESKDIRR